MELLFLTIHFLAFIPPTFGEVQALRTTANALLHQNCLFQQANEELAHRNTTLTKQVRCLSAILGIHIHDYTPLLMIPKGKEDKERGSI